MAETLTQTMQWPPCTDNAEGEMRRIGVELEFAGIDLTTAADTVASMFGGDCQRQGSHRFVIAGTRFGDFEVELDSDYVHPRSPLELEGNLLERAAAATRAVIGDVIELWMPREIVTPPMRLADLPEVDRLCTELRERGAVGTNNHWAYAFALQLNPEVPSLDCDRVLAHFQAYLLLADWLHAVAAQDRLRAALAFAKPFPRDYMRKVLAEDYRPDWPAFIDDYTATNPTRNRDLDLCPLFAFIDEARVKAAIDDPRIKARPTFHYRVPDSRVEDPQWSIVGEWNRWVEVERLAADAEALAARRQRFLREFADKSEKEWVEHTKEWLQQ